MIEETAGSDIPMMIFALVLALGGFLLLWSVSRRAPIWAVVLMWLAAMLMAGWAIFATMLGTETILYDPDLTGTGDPLGTAMFVMLINLLLSLLLGGVVATVVAVVARSRRAPPVGAP